MSKKTIAQQNRVYTQQLDQHPDHKWAIFTRETNRNAAYFRCLIDNQEEAVEIARKYAAEAVSRGWLDFTYYVVEIKHRVGIEAMKPIDKPT